MRWRRARISARDSVRISRPSNTISPASGSYRRSSALPSVDLPQPDSPTRPSVSPRAISKLTPSRACRYCLCWRSRPLRCAKYLRRLRILSRVSLTAPAPSRPAASENRRRRVDHLRAAAPLAAAGLFLMLELFLTEGLFLTKAPFLTEELWRKYLSETNSGSKTDSRRGGHRWAVPDRRWWRAESAVAPRGPAARRAARACTDGAAGRTDPRHAPARRCDRRTSRRRADRFPRSRRDRA